MTIVWVANIKKTHLMIHYEPREFLSLLIKIGVHYGLPTHRGLQQILLPSFGFNKLCYDKGRQW
jgi:hypothetical protein